MLSPEVSRTFSQRQGLANTLEEPPDVASGASLLWLEPVEDEARRATLWQRVREGERPERLAA
jgi:putative spermidine/putrescine transport system substrate-binding protein